MKIAIRKKTEDFVWKNEKGKKIMVQMGFSNNLKNYPDFFSHY